jgi:hypothetical protein
MKPDKQVDLVWRSRFGTPEPAEMPSGGDELPAADRNRSNTTQLRNSRHTEMKKVPGKGSASIDEFHGHPSATMASGFY